MICFSAMTVCSLMACQKPSSSEESKVSQPWSDSLVMAIGDKIISQTFDTLRNSLVNAIQKEGFEGAIGFCHENATGLMPAYTDSVVVRRTALRYRNPLNKPDVLETEILEGWSKTHSAGEKLAPRLVRANGQLHYFKPIHMQAMCMNCHGSPQKNIRPATLSAIRKNYPGDMAIDFREGDLRGSWHLVFSDRR